MNAEFDGGWSNLGRESKDYERLPETGEAFIRIVMIRLILIQLS